MPTGENIDEKPPAGLYFKQVLRKIFLEDWVMKLVALVITFALWVGVTGLSTPTTTRMSGIPLSLRFSNNTDVTNSPIQEVDIVISGDKRKIAQINKNDLIVTFDLTDVIPGDRVIQLTPESVSNLPNGVKVDEIQPNRIAIRLEAVEEKDVEVIAETEGELPDGFEIYGKTVSPQAVRVRGPASFMRSLTSVPTEPISLANRTADFTTQQVPVEVSNANAAPPVVDVEFRIGERRIERLYLVPLQNQPGKKATVVLYGGRSLFTDIQPQDLHVQIVKDAAGQDTPQLTLPPALEGKVEIRRLKVN